MTHAPFTRRVVAVAALLAGGAVPAFAQSDRDGLPSGWYVGAAGSLASHDGPDEGVFAALAGAGFNNPSFDDHLDGSAYKIYAGYRFESVPFAFEAAWVDFSNIDGDYAVPPPPGGVGGAYNESSEGLQVMTRTFLYEDDDLDLALRIGGYYRSSDVDVLAQPGSVPLSYSTDKFDTVVGLDASWRFTEMFSVRGEWERFFMDGKDVDLFSLGLSLDFD